MIIDGVDVSGCEFHTTRFLGYEGQNYCKIYDCTCEEPIGDDCYYKQLQRTTTQYDTVLEQNKSLQTELKTKEQECEELKERLNEVLCDVDTKECEHRMFCGEPIGYGCRAYENQSCNENDFLNCHFRQKQRFKLENICYKQALMPFEDEYFKDLDTKTIAELAKKSIRLTRENRKLEDTLDEIERLAWEVPSCSEANDILEIIDRARGEQ